MARNRAYAPVAASDFRRVCRYWFWRKHQVCWHFRSIKKGVKIALRGRAVACFHDKVGMEAEWRLAGNKRCAKRKNKIARYDKFVVDRICLFGRITEMRTEQEITRAHDLLAGIILGETLPLDPVTENMIRLEAGVLCWVLNHDHNTAFEEHIANIEKILAKAGYVLSTEKPPNN
jgi:hypothetical protein